MATDYRARIELVFKERGITVEKFKAWNEPTNGMVMVSFMFDGALVMRQGRTDEALYEELRMWAQGRRNEPAPGAGAVGPPALEPRPLPCPFCGAFASARQMEHNPKKFMAGCESRIGCRVAPVAVADSIAAAVEAWNRRA